MTEEYFDLYKRCRDYKYPYDYRQKNLEDIKAYQNKTLNNLDDFILRNGNLIISFMNKNIPQSILSIHRDDIFQQGLFGLQEAIKRFDINKNMSFSTYATYWIKAYIYQYCNKLSLIKIPTEINKKLNAYKKTVNTYYDKKQEYPNDNWLCEKLQMTMEELNDIRKYDYSIISYEALVQNIDNGENASFDILYKMDSIPSSNDIDKKIDYDDILNKLKTFCRTERDYQICYERFCNGKTFEEIGFIYHISKQRVSEIIQRTKNKILSEYSLFV